jgi:hypothetical protein
VRGQCQQCSERLRLTCRRRRFLAVERSKLANQLAPVVRREGSGGIEKLSYAIHDQKPLVKLVTDEGEASEALRKAGLPYIVRP